MLRTRVGYCGGDKKEPTYRSIGDHTEALSIDFDPTVLSFGDILEIFWRNHDFSRNRGSRQYRNALFFRNDEQQEAAEASKPAGAATDIELVGEFTIAEGYHQKYYLTRYREIRAFLESHYPTAKELADSAVATRLNAFLGSGMDRKWGRFLEELPEYGLPEEMEAEVRGMVG